jgi:hypothetical protein
MMAIGPKGQLVIVEIKVSRTDLMGDQKWTDYLEYCDRFFWAVPQVLSHLLDEARFLPDHAGLMVADATMRWSFETLQPSTSPRKAKAETLRLPRRPKTLSA